MGHETIHDPTREQAEDALRKVQILNAESSKLMSTVRNYVKTHGGFSVLNSDGTPVLHAYNQQTMGMMPIPELLAEACVSVDAAKILTFFLCNKATPAQLNWLLYKSPWKEYLQAELCIEDGEGLMEYFGKAETDARAKPPEEGKHHVVYPGEKARKTGDDMYTEDGE